MAALAAFTWWGITPIYFKLLQTVSPLEIIIHRIIWAAPLIVVYLFLRDGRDFWKRLILPRRTLIMLFVTGLMMGMSWLLFIWSVINSHVIETSFGYFIAPLVTVLMGFAFLGERLTRIQFVAALVVGAGLFYLGWFLGKPPWISLGLAGSVCGYALLRKKLGVGPMVGLFWEIVLVAVPMMLLAMVFAGETRMQFGHSSRSLDLLLMAAGLVTILPLYWFNLSAHHLPLKFLGMFQFIAPTSTFMLAVFLWDETMTQGHLVAFSSILLGLVLVFSETMIKARRAALP